MYRSRISFLFLISFYGSLLSQVDLIESPLAFSKLPITGTVADLLNIIERESGITLSYTSSQFDSELEITLPDQNYTVKTAINSVLTNYNIYLTRLSARKYQIIVSRKKSYSISGLIKDEDSGEIIPGALIFNAVTNEYVMSDDKGFYFMNLPSGESKLLIKFLGYKDQFDTIFVTNSLRHNFTLQFQNSISPVIVSEKVADYHLLDPGTDLIPSSRLGSNSTIFGDKDILSNIKTSAGVTSGGEGQSGIYVRGGNSNQNLIILDGITLYEASHTAGISSIFLNESIRSADFIKSAIPAQYSGRLSSVLNLQLKDGNPNQSRHTIQAGLLGLKFISEGPISNNKKWSYMVGGRTSLISPLLELLAPKISVYDDINIDMDDLNAKTSFRFNNNSKLTFTTYLGKDRLSLLKNKSNTTLFQSNEKNELKWSNALFSLNYDNVISKKSKIHVNLGFLKYKYKSQSIYEITDSLSSTYLDVISFSQIRDLQFKINYDYYLSERTKFKIGLTAIGHRIDPSVKQSIIKINGEDNPVFSPDSSIYSTDNFIYGEASIKIDEDFVIYPGVNISSFKTQNKTFNRIQPRMRIAFIPNLKTVISISYTNAVQNLHLLSNPGIGLPSDLWVPSTDKIAPEMIDHFSIDINQSLIRGWSFQLSGYTKELKNVIEYDQPTDLFINLINKDSLVPVFTQQSDWQNHVKSGNAHTTGFEATVRKDQGKWKSWLTFSYNNTLYRFEEIDNGNPYPAKYNRPYDVNFGLNFEPSLKWSFGLNAVYSSGNYFTFPNEAFSSVLGVELLKPTGRNNYKLPDFHQLSLSSERSIKVKGMDGKLNFGVYNVYNRLNTYFIYALNSTLSAKPTFRKVSIFPILPFINFSMSW